jgi:hypothetical protein
MVVMGIFNAGGSYEYIDGITLIRAFASAGGSNERGALFVPEFDALIHGFIQHDTAMLGTTSEGSVKLYDDVDTVLTSKTLDPDQSSTGQTFVYFDEAIQLTAGETYRLTYDHTGGNNNTILTNTTMTNQSAEMLKTMHGVDTFYTTSRTGGGAGGAWTDVNTTAPLFSLILEPNATGGASPSATGYGG